jgi:hypothetical protein
MNPSHVENVNESRGNRAVRRYLIPGSRQFSNYWWGLITALGSAGFLVVGISSRSPSGGLPFLAVEGIRFVPQGLVMCFYGVLGGLFSIYLWLSIFWDVGGGFNEFDQKRGLVRLFRWGFPGNNRRIDLSHSIEDVESIKVEMREGINPRRTIYMRIKGDRDIPLTSIGQPITLSDIESEAAELARFIGVPIELIG